MNQIAVISFSLLLTVTLFGPGLVVGQEHLSPEVQNASDYTQTGEDIDVGVIDLGFNATSSTSISENVEEFQTFGTNATVSDGDADTHGTLVSEIVLQQAPNSSLYLASADPTGDPDWFKSALSWLHDEQDVDVIVISLGFWNVYWDGQSGVSQEVQQVTEEGTAVVTSAGNYGQQNWRGELETTDGEYLKRGDKAVQDVTFEVEESTSSSTFYILGESREDPYPGNLTMEVNGQTEYDVDFGDRPVVRGSSNGGDIPINLQGGDTVRFKGDPGEISLILRSNRLVDPVRSGSISAPGDTPGAMAIGAIDGEGNLESYSAAGPTLGGHWGIDHVAVATLETEGSQLADPDNPRLAGTSFAAPNVGGVMALLYDHDPTLTYNESREILQDVGTYDDPAANNYRRGYGQINRTELFSLGEFNIHNVYRDGRTVLVNASNDGRIRGYRDFNVTVDGQSIDSELKHLEAGEQDIIEVDYSTNLYGNRTLAIDNQSWNLNIQPSPEYVTVDNRFPVKYRLDHLNLANTSTPGGHISQITVTQASGSYDVTFNRLEPGAQHSVYRLDRGEGIYLADETPQTVTANEDGQVTIRGTSTGTYLITRNSVGGIQQAQPGDILIGSVFFLTLLGAIGIHRRREARKTEEYL